jgi:hypothetical protein
MGIKMGKKAFYFTIDSIIAGGIVLTVILLISSFHVEEPFDFHLNYLSQDLIRVLGTLTVKEINNGYLNSLVSDGTIKNPENTVLEQIAEFWAKNQLEFANKSVSNVTGQWLPSNIGFGMWINNEAIYNRDSPIRKSLVSSKKLLSGIEKGKTNLNTRQSPPTLWGPAIVEVRLWE